MKTNFQQPKPKVEVVFAPDGIEVVRLYGTSWSDQPSAVQLFDRLMPFIRQMHDLLADEETADKQVLLN